MNRTVIERASVLVLLLAICAAFAVPALATETIDMRSGGGYAIGATDPAWQYTLGPVSAPQQATPFTAADFNAVFSGPNAVVVAPYGSFWLSGLLCDGLSQWISVDANRGPASALFGQIFTVHTCCIQKATLSFCWASDDNIGDQVFGGPNPQGLYLNGTPLSFNGGSYATENGGSVDVTTLLHCSKNNQIHVYNRDAAAVVSGAMFSIHIEIEECGPLPTEPSTWGAVKSMYR